MRDCYDMMHEMVNELKKNDVRLPPFGEIVLIVKMQDSNPVRKITRVEYSDKDVKKTA